jgi:aspartyl-tRNA(Asn)/glutamyl-tRNA(Gln) amidotransferase subunit A
MKASEYVERARPGFRGDALLLRNTSVVDMRDGCPISLRCRENGELPADLMVWHGAKRDATILNLALQIERLLSSPFPIA